MNPKLLLRIAAGLCLFFAAGHTMGHATRKDATNPIQAALIRSMDAVEFDLGPQQVTYGGMYTGMSLNLILVLLALSALLWILSGAAAREPATVRALSWPLCLLLAGFAVTSFLYFFIVPAATSALAAAAVGVAALRLRS